MAVHGNHRDDWYSLTVRSGRLRLYPQCFSGPLNPFSGLLLQKFPARCFRVTTVVESSKALSFAMKPAA
ncbi:MAG: hypothetical protein JXR25_01475 [Pontiellaceae bacterium]|nr:hypothetical protein [Pontiellaceae bacterium]MBN2783469.1 hypothetical protein [Pontiellaceae bacterium]